MRLLKFKAERGNEVMKVLEKEFRKEKLEEGAIVSVIGAVDDCCISNMRKEDSEKDKLSEYHEPFELSGVGEIRNGKPHIHCTLSGKGDKAYAGHLHWAKVKNWYVAVYVIVT